jgi:hypothetical protein
LAFWNKGKDKDQAANQASGQAAAAPAPTKGAMEFSPEKAKKFFTHAQAAQEIGNYEYAMSLWMGGLKFDPGNLEAVKSFTACANGYLNNGGAKRVPKETVAAMDGSTPVHKYLQALAEWTFAARDNEKAVRAATTVTELNLREVANYIAPTVLKVLIGGDQPTKKDQAVRMMKAFINLESFDLAVQAGELAKKIDPSDAPLANEVKNLAAQATMNRGGYENTGKEGGFRSNIRDMEKQRRLMEDETISKSEGVLDRNLQAAKAEYDLRPTDRPTIKKYAAALVSRGKPEDEQQAQAVLLKAYTDLSDFSFKQLAGDLKMKLGRRKLRELKAAMDAAPSDAAARHAYVTAENEQLAMEIAEYQALAQAYPTDLPIKYELGKRYFLAGKHTEAIEQLQACKGEGKNKAAVLYFLAQSFQAIDWLDEAIDTFRLATEAHSDPNDQMGMDLRYGLMAALLLRGQTNKDLASLEEADKIASGIAMQSISFRDIRDKRAAIKSGLQAIRAGGASA